MPLTIIDCDYAPGMVGRRSFSVCMTVRNEADGIDSFIDSLVAQTLKPVEIVIVDAGSTDGTADRIEERAAAFGNVTIIRERDMSHAEARNIACSAARTPIIVSVDAGCILTAGLFANLLAPFHICVDVVAGAYRPIYPSPWAGYFIPNWNDEPYLREKFLPSTRNVAFRKELFDFLGGFPAHLKQRCGEDTLFMTRAKDLGCDIVLNRAALVLWHAPVTQDEACRLAYRYGMGNGEIGCSAHADAYAQSTDPVLMSAHEGYRLGCKLREVFE